MRKRLRLLQRELNMTRPAVRRGAASEVEVLRIEQSIHQIRGEMSAKRSESIKELEISIAELAKVQEEAHGLKDRLHAHLGSFARKRRYQTNPCHHRRWGN